MSKLLAPKIVGIVIVLLIVGGIFAWQYFGIPKEETEAPEELADETANRKTYRNEEYGFEFKYPSDIIFIPEQIQYAPILGSSATTNIEESPVYDLAIYIDNIKISAYEDAQNKVKDLPVYLEGLGPYEQQINEILVYVVLTKLYGGVQGLTRIYYFPNFVLKFSYANNVAEEKLKDIEQRMLSTFRFLD